MTFEEWWSAQSADTKIDNAKYAAEEAWDAAMELAVNHYEKQGYVLVPLEPTDDMFSAGEYEIEAGMTAYHVYSAMIDEAQGE